MEINVGDYVISKDRLKIGQVKDFCKCEMCKDRGFYEPIITNNIYITNYDKDNNFENYTFSKDILNIIEIGDYVNGRLVCNVGKGNKYIYLIDFPDLINIKANDEIRTILTKQQFEANAYTIEKER